jgi:7-carboxy-7-deazaguanine synthase
MLKVSRQPSGEPEIFRSIQGEGISAGTPTVFLRLATCNLACSWCDTKYTWDWDNFDREQEILPLSTNDAESRIVDFDVRHLVVTGGEPLLQQKDLAPLLESLREKNYRIEVETNGTIAPSQEMLEHVSQWNVSPKIGNSANTASRREVPKALESFATQDNAYWKFVIVSRQDVNEASGLASRYGVPAERVILMPEGVTADVLTERGAWLAEECARQGFRFSTRLHIHLWGNERGR